jgi:hypothetical protein
MDCLYTLKHSQAHTIELFVSARAFVEFMPCEAASGPSAWMERSGPPKALVADRGSHFMSTLVREVECCLLFHGGVCARPLYERSHKL